MEYAAPIILFLFGFGAALLARRVALSWSLRRGGRGSKKLPVQKGAVRLDQVEKNGKGQRRG